MCADLQIRVTADVPYRVALQGIRGCFSHQALMEFFPVAQPVFCERATETRDALRFGRADGILLPVKNSLAGPVTEHQQLIRHISSANEASVIAERTMAIRQQLIGIRGAKTDQLQRVYSHPVALAQCRRFFSQHPWLHPEPFFDTAGSVARVIAENVATQAAIAGTLAAKTYNGEILLADIQDSPDNSTHFVLLWALNRELPTL
jgi:prephenate dehydratase